MQTRRCGVGMKPRKRLVYDLCDHRVMREALRWAYAVGEWDHKRGRNAPRTGQRILEIIQKAADWQRINSKDAHLRYLKSTYQAAKFNSQMQKLTGGYPWNKMNTLTE
jgi:hypothetical protein